MLELAPQTESRVQEYAARQGVNADALINRLLEQALPPAPVDNPVLRQLQKQLSEAENATPEEIAEAEAKWLAFQQNLNETRRENGERLLFPEITP